MPAAATSSLPPTYGYEFDRQPGHPLRTGEGGGVGAAIVEVAPVLLECSLICANVGRDGLLEWEAFFRCFPALTRIDLPDFADGVRHFAAVPDHKTRSSVLDDLGESARAKRDNRCSAGKRLHRDQRTRLGREARDEEATRGAQQPPFASEIRAGPASDAEYLRASGQFGLRSTGDELRSRTPRRRSSPACPARLAASMPMWKPFSGQIRPSISAKPHFRHRGRNEPKSTPFGMTAKGPPFPGTVCCCDSETQWR